MWSIIGSTLIAAALVANHLVHGWGCWGLQPGGPVSARLYALQILLALLTCVYAYIHLLQGKFPGGRILLIILTFCLISMATLFATRGTVVFTSVHFQGPENLLPFAASSATAIWGGIAVRLTRKLPPE